MVALSAKMNTTPHNNQIHFLVQEIPGQVGTKPHTEFDQTPSLRAVMQYIRAVNQGGWLARLPILWHLSVEHVTSINSLLWGSRASLGSGLPPLFLGPSMDPRLSPGLLN